MAKRLALLGALLVALVLPASALSASGNPNEGGGGGGGTQLCTYGMWVYPGEFKAVCGYNNWREVVHSTAYVSGCYSNLNIYPYGPSDYRCGDVSGLHLNAGGGYNTIIAYNLTSSAYYVAGTANT